MKVTIELNNVDGETALKLHNCPEDNLVTLEWLDEISDIVTFKISDIQEALRKMVAK